jgi:hypothetical protein
MGATGVTTQKHDEKIANMVFASIYPLYLAKITKAGRTQAELNEVIFWLTNFDNNTLTSLIDCKATIKEFFAKAKLNPKANLIKGVICGYRIEEISTPLTRKCRYLDKLVDELAEGKLLEKILRK